MEKLQILSPLRNDADIAFCKLFGGVQNQRASDMLNQDQSPEVQQEESLLRG